MPKPNTFIVGAPKCGTTALAFYLSEHPSIYVSDPKEPHFFVNEEMPFKSNYRSIEQYLRIFESADANHKIIAEASVWYLYSDTAISKIAKFNNQSKIIAMLRRPDEMIYSMHSQGVVTLQENIENFEEAWSLAVSNEKRSSFSKLCKEPKLLEYDKIAKYGEQIKRLLEYIPPSKLHIIFHDDFQNNTRDVYQNVLNFLEVTNDRRREFPRVNPNTELRSRFFGRLLKKPPKMLLRGASVTKQIFGIQKLGVKKALTQLNQKKTTREKLSNSTKKAIIDCYREDIRLLERITSRDLSHWLE